ncbi:MAG: hypothetical protein AB7O62_12300 [Pirellulales bacterium]
MPSPYWIIFEQTNRWAVALRSAVGIGRFPWRETRHSDDCLALLSASPASVVTLELTLSRLNETLELLITVGQKYPRARATVVADRSLEGQEWLVRELGAAAFTSSPRELASLVAVARHRLATAEKSDIGLAERIRQDLPWN